jgi:HK97 family phage portal protein
MFLASAGTETETGGRGPVDDFWYEPLPSRSSGIRVSDDTAMRIATFYACVNVISQDLAKVPLLMYRRKDNERSRALVRDHPVVKLLRQPTPRFNGVPWREREQAHQLLRGNAYCEMRSNWRGIVTELRPLDPDTMRVEEMQDESLRYHFTDPTTKRERTLLQGEVLHLRGLSLKGPLGLSPVDQARERLGETYAAQQYAASFFANDARPSIWAKHPSHFKDESVRKDWVKSFKKAFGGGNRFNPLITEYGIEIQNLPPIDHAQLQFLELRKLGATEICAIFRVPPHKVAILERATNNNIEHQGIEYGTDCLLTWCRRWEEQLAAELFSDAERDELYFEFELDALMRGDRKSRYEAYQSGITAGWLVRNEVRRRENLDALAHLDEPLQPVNMVPAGTQVGVAPGMPGTGATSPAGGVPPADDGAGSDDAQDARAHELELQARRRVLTRETRALEKAVQRAAGDKDAFVEAVTSFYAWHLPFVAQALAIETVRAEAYCMAQLAEVERALEAGVVLSMLAAWEADVQAMQFPPLPPATPKET